VCLERKRRPVFAICISNFLPAASNKKELPAIIIGAAGASRFPSTCSSSVDGFDFSFEPASVISSFTFFDVPIISSWTFLCVPVS